MSDISDVKSFGDIDFMRQLERENDAPPPPNAKRLISRNISANEMREWYALVDVKAKANWLITKGIVFLDPTGKFARRNNQLRSIDEMPNKRRAAIHARDKECAYCGSSVLLVVDHVIPFMAWPEQLLWLANTSGNLVSACEPCNKSKSANYNDLSYKNPYQIVFECINCGDWEHKPCQVSKVYCAKCKDVSSAMTCSFSTIECERIDY